MVMFGKLTNCLPENTYVILKYTNNHHTKNIVSMQKKKEDLTQTVECHEISFYPCIIRPEFQCCGSSPDTC